MLHMIHAEAPRCPSARLMGARACTCTPVPRPPRSKRSARRLLSVREQTQGRLAAASLNKGVRWVRPPDHRQVACIDRWDLEA